MKMTMLRDTLMERCDFGHKMLLDFGDKAPCDFAAPGRVHLAFAQPSVYLTFAQPLLQSVFIPNVERSSHPIVERTGS